MLVEVDGPGMDDCAKAVFVVEVIRGGGTGGVGGTVGDVGRGIGIRDFFAGGGAGEAGGDGIDELCVGREGDLGGVTGGTLKIVDKTLADGFVGATDDVDGAVRFSVRTSMCFFFGGGGAVDSSCEFDGGDEVDEPGRFDGPGRIDGTDVFGDGFVFGGTDVVDETASGGILGFSLDEADVFVDGLAVGFNSAFGGAHDVNENGRRGKTVVGVRFGVVSDVDAVDFNGAFGATVVVVDEECRIDGLASGIGFLVAGSRIKNLSSVWFFDLVTSIFRTSLQIVKYN